MMSGRNIVIGLVVLLVCVAVFFWVRPDREKQVRRQLDRLVEYVAKEPAEPAMVTLTKIGGIGKLFAQSCSLEVENPAVEGLYSRKEVMDRVAMARRYFTELHISLHDISISFPASSRADIVLTLRVNGRKQDEPMTDTREVEFSMDRPEKQWLISRVKMVEVLKQ